jgi:alcohol dehydrogenase, propanol-preferring
MRAMRLHEIGQQLRLDEVAAPAPGLQDVTLRVTACGVCRTDLHIIEGDLPPHRLPLIPGHEIVGVVTSLGSGVAGVGVGDKVGVPWMGGTCGCCPYCLSGQDNLCDAPTFTGYDVDGGYAEFATARSSACIPLPGDFPDVEGAPMLCAGLIGFRAYSRTSGAKRLGLIGFGAAAHIISQIARDDGVDVFAFTRPGDVAGQQFAKELGAVWAGGTDEVPGSPLDAVIIFAPVGELVPLSLRLVRKGGVVVCAGIHMSDIPSFRYGDLWGERQIVSVANLTREDARLFFANGRARTIRTSVTPYRLVDANSALHDLKAGILQGAAVLVP